MANEKTFDVVDVLQELNNKFTHLKFITEDQESKSPGGTMYTEHVFKLKASYGKLHFPLIPTTITIRENEEITQEKLDQIIENVNKFLPKYYVLND